ncbi:MAG TPA: hypothetical protein VGZ72_00600 [Stellaceae bacterium]|nr:hypothetical protein [Stellaceae bacterium]
MIAARFLLTALLWGGGALMTALQAGVVPAPVSVAYRMTLVGGILLPAGRDSTIRHLLVYQGIGSTFAS